MKYKTSASPPRRTYNSAKRAAQKEETRQHILDVLVLKMMQGNFDAASMEDIAAAAGVGTTTLYRYFPSREALWDGLSNEFNRLVGSTALPRTPDEVVATIQRDFAIFDQHPGLVQAFFLSELGRNARAGGRARRLEALRGALADVTQHLEGAERARVIAIISYLASLQSWVTMTTELGLPGEQAGVAVAWAIETLLAAVKEKEHANN
jgi:AcrR family transcriptional regulator